MWDQAAQQPSGQSIGINDTFSQCVDTENAKMTAIGTNLLNFANLASQSQDLERIYANLYDAYQQGIESLEEYRHKLTEASYLEQGYTSRMTETQRKAIEQVPAAKRPAVFHLMGGLVACMDRPTDVFREVLKAHQKEIFDNLMHLAQSDEITADAYYKNVVYIVNLLCLFDVVEQDNTLAMWGGVGAGIFGFLLGTESGFKPLDEMAKLFDSGSSSSKRKTNKRNDDDDADDDDADDDDDDDRD